jgi:hypothetical protein
MERSYTYEQLVEKIVRAKLKLEMKRPKRVEHSVSCPVDADPDYYGPCRCGAGEMNSANDDLFSDVLKELTL